MDRARFNRDNPNKDWFDWWLSDDPPPPEVKAEIRQKRVAQANSYHPRGSHNISATSVHQPTEAPEPGLPNVTINIALPKVKLPNAQKLVPKVKLPSLPYRRMAVGFMTIAAVSLISFGLYSWLHSSKPGRAKAETPLTGPSTVNIPLNFTPVTPLNKPELATLTAGKTAYDSTRGTYSFVDVLLGTRLTVSQQALPKTFGSPQQAVTSIADSTGAKDTIFTRYGTAYMSTDKSGTQVIVFSMKNLLIFIQSPFRHDTTDWKNYIDNLQ